MRLLGLAYDRDMTAPSLWSEFVERKIGTALMLDKGECNGSYSDACVLLSSLLSGIAAELWPGKGIDRCRFVELWARFADPKLQPALISVPLLRRHFHETGRSDDASILEATRPEMFDLGNGCLILLGSQVDMTEGDVLALPLPAASKKLRSFSYPAIFYSHVRSSLTHEYKLSDDAASHYMTRQKANVSYVNRSDPEASELSRRLIHFHMVWLAEVARSIASNVAGHVDNYEILPRPKQWWVNG